jgi:hypothetical protein
MTQALVATEKIIKADTRGRLRTTAERREFMLAKFADIPTVLLRTDFRKAGDSPQDPWNLMLSDYPRTEKIILNGMDVYSAARSTVNGSDDEVTQKATAQFVLDGVASRVVESFNNVISSPPRLPAHLREPVMEWLSLMPNFIINSREALELIQGNLGVQARAFTVGKFGQKK